MSARTRTILAVGIVAFVALLLAVGVPLGTVTKVAAVLGIALAVFPSDRPCTVQFTSEDHDTLTCNRAGLHLNHRTDDGTLFLRVPGGVRITEPTP